MPSLQNNSQADDRVQQNHSALIWPELTRFPSFNPPLRLGVMASGQGSNFEALVESTRTGPLDGTIELLVVNNPQCGARKRAERLGIPCIAHDHRLQSNREALDQQLVNSFRQADVEAIVMAGWMRIVTPVLINAFKNRLINIHPSLLPSFRGVNAVEQAFNAGVTLAGCSVHLVVPEVDAGRILAQAAVPVLSSDDPVSLRARIQVQEHRLLPLAVAVGARDWRRH